MPLPAKGRPFASAGAFFSISPEILKPIRRERRVANRRNNRPVAKIVLDRAGLPPIVGQLVAARVAQHMAVVTANFGCMNSKRPIVPIIMRAFFNLCRAEIEKAQSPKTAPSQR